MRENIPHRHVLGMRVDATSYSQATNRIVQAAKRGESRYVCVATVNNVMESYDSPATLRAMNEADLVTPDGMPLVWALKALGIRSASRVYGPDLMPLVMGAAAEAGLGVGLYGSTEEVLKRLERRISCDWPHLKVKYRHAPPFRALSWEEDAEVTRQIAESDASILFVGLPSPKQDLWMANHKGKLDVVMIGVGAAFDFVAGTKTQAPRWMMSAGLEWLFRLWKEPRRLWKRYVKHNPRFVLYSAVQVFQSRLPRKHKL